MAYHVDIISNEPLTGRQTLLGRAHIEHGELRIEAAMPDQLRDTLCRIVPDIDPREDAEGFARALPERMDYTYLIASEPHADDECLFDQIGDEPAREPGRAPYALRA
jgi:hypothetical protein